MYKALIFIAGLLVTFQSVAHSGHDHTDPMSPYIHLLWVVALAVGAVALFIYIKRKAANASKAQHKGATS